MESWDPDKYMRFGDERTRPAVDLATHIAVERPATVIDLGCGPGNSTRVLRMRWPEAYVVGLDSSPQMIEAARAQEPGQEWLLSGIQDWAPAAPFDVVFSNAALQWLPDHGALVQRLFGTVRSGGALAFQIPSARFAAVRTLVDEVALAGPWASRMAGPLGELTMEAPGVYYDCLARLARSVNMWETEFFHVMDSAAGVVEWISSTYLGLFLGALESGAERQRFLALLQERVDEAYPRQKDGRVLFPFKRIFVVAYRP